MRLILFPSCPVYRRPLFTSFLLLLGLTLATPLRSFAMNMPAEITFGFNPAENAEVMETNGKIFSEYMAKKLNVKVKTFIATDYVALIESMRPTKTKLGSTSFGFLPPFSYIKAEGIAGAEVLLKAVRKGQAVFYSAIITSKDKPYKSVQDLKGKTMAWVDVASSSGHIVPKASLMSELHIDPETFFSKQIFAGAHDSLVLAVVNGTVDAGATFAHDPKGLGGSWTQFFKGPEQNKIKVLYVTPAIPGDTLATTSKFSAMYPELVAKVRDILAHMHEDKEGLKIMKELYHVDSFVPSKSSDFDSVRKAAKAVDAL